MVSFSLCSLLWVLWCCMLCLRLCFTLELFLYDEKCMSPNFTVPSNFPSSTCWRDFFHYIFLLPCWKFIALGVWVYLGLSIDSSSWSIYSFCPIPAVLITEARYCLKLELRCFPALFFSSGWLVNSVFCAPHAFQDYLF